MNRRRDYKTALLIDAAIYSSSAEVRAHAAGELSERPLPPDFEMRIFLEPNRRRHNPPSQQPEFPE
ncbi:hypothetical protein AB4Z32_02595 [Massilia sp. 2TAF26]|uniref:hypothetical protein n=1 Tax=Massilia sp. 2TAF26 TaxID=3233012 RepID=UPI003F9C2C56